MLNIASEWLIILFIVLINAAFVVAEIALLTSRKSRLQTLAKKGVFGANKAISLKEKPEFFLSTVQVGITLMSILIGFYGGKELVGHIAGYISTIRLVGKYSIEIANTLIIIVITFITVLGEIIPKRIAMLYPEKSAILVAWVMTLFMKMFYPFVLALSISTRWVLRILAIKEVDNHISAEELKHIITQAENEGTVEKAERDMITRLIHLSDMKVGAIMTPRRQIIAIDIEIGNQENITKLLDNQFSYFPVISGSFDNVIGMVSVKSILKDKVKIGNTYIRDHLQPVLYVPDSARLSQLLELFKAEKSKIALVTDEYGDIEGIVTLNDILKTFIGDIATQVDGAKPSITNRKDGSWIVSGNLLVEELKALLSIDLLPGEDDDEYRTLASFILAQFDQYPKVGDTCKAEGYVFKIIKMDAFRIDRVLIKKLIN